MGGWFGSSRKLSHLFLVNVVLWLPKKVVPLGTNSSGQSITEKASTGTPLLQSVVEEYVAARCNADHEKGPESWERWCQGHRLTSSHGAESVERLWWGWEIQLNHGTLEEQYLCL
nr:PREDICTED: uncharacterized protein LOC108951568 [Musa acuminata subsp. malaccensis]